MQPLDRLDNIKDLERLFRKHYRELLRIPEPTDKPIQLGALFCPDCGDVRRIEIDIKFLPRKGRTEKDPLDALIHTDPSYLHHVHNVRMTTFVIGEDLIPQLVPTLMACKCVHCHHEYTLVIYRGPNGPDVAVFPTKYGGLSTTNTPDTVGRYLDEAHRTKTVSAHAATLAMFRGALDAILYDQGYKKGMCGRKINDLESAIEAGTAPAWAAYVDTDSLSVMKELANVVLHSNDKSPKVWLGINSSLVGKVEAILALLLYHVFERDLADTQRRQDVEKALGKSPRPAAQPAKP